MALTRRAGAGRAASGAPHRGSTAHAIRPTRAVAAATALVVAAGMAAAAPAAACTPPTAVTRPAVHAASPAQLDAALRRLARRDPSRVRVATAGRSAEGRPIRYALVSGGSRAAPRGSRPVVLAGGSVHGNERSGGDALIGVLRDLIARDGCLRAGVVRAGVDVLLVPDQNPDGRTRRARHNALGFDLNRDLIAQSQPETTARVTLLRTYRPLAWLDLHEEGGVRAFAPPYAQPIHPLVGAFARRAIARDLGPAIRAAWHRAGWATESRAYDLLFPGYGDAAATLLARAAGMTIEVGSDLPYRGRVARDAAAVEAVVRRVAAHRAALVAALRADRRRAARPASGGPQGWALPDTDDARALARRLQRAGARVEVLAAPAVATVRPWTAGAAPARVTLAAGTLLLGRAQPAGAWLEAVLGTGAAGHDRDAATTDVTAWSPALLAGLGGGALDAPLHGPPARSLGPAVPDAPAAGYAADAGSVRGLGLALDLLARGAPVLRAGDAIVVPGLVALADVVAAARQRGASVRALDAVPAGAVPLRAPRVALLDDPGASSARPPGPMPTASTAWARWVLRERLGVDPVAVGDAEIGDGALERAGVTTLVVPDGATPAGGLGDAALERVGAFVRAGGTLLAWRARGAAVAARAGLLAAADGPVRATLRGAALAVVAAGAAPFPVLADGDEPSLGGPAAATWGDRLAGDASGLAALRGRAAVVSDAAGTGRATVLAFDPAFRASAEAAERFVALQLLGGGAA